MKLKLLATLALPVLALPALGAPPAADATAYRCGAERNSYRDTACPDGAPVPVTDRRTPQQVEQARDAARREQALADQWAAERRRDQAVARPAINLTPRGAAAPAKGTKPAHAKARAKAKVKVAKAKVAKPDARRTKAGRASKPKPPPAD